jgi:hypothetical protein
VRYLRKLIAKLSDDRGGTGTVDAATGEFRATPWIERETGGGHALYTGRDGSVWLYGVIRNHPLYYEDDEAILDVGRRVENVLAEIGKTSLSRSFGVRSTASYRDVHVLSVRWEGTPEVPPGTPTDAQAAYLGEVLDCLHVPQQATFLGVKLRDIDALAAARSRSVLDMSMELVAGLLRDAPTDYAAYDPDRRHLAAVLRRHDCRAPTRAERRRLEAWFNDGRHAEPEIVRLPEMLVVGAGDEIEFVALERFTAPLLRAPDSMWLADAFNLDHGPDVVSLRAQLQTGEDTNRDLRRSLRSQSQDHEAEKAHDPHGAGGEAAERVEFTRAVRKEYAQGRDVPSLLDCSVIFGRRTPPTHATETFVEYLSASYGIETKPLGHRQMLALDEVQPCSRVRCSPWPQRLNLAMVAYSGVASFTDLGDPEGAFVGQGLPDGAPVYFDPLAASRQDRPPTTYICGRPGSGKTMLLQLLCLQSVLMGHRVIVVNPKGFDSLQPFVDLVNRETDHSAERVSLATLASEEGGGAFDPFRFARPDTAASIAANFITTVIDLDQRQRTALRFGLNRGAVGGAGCVGEALKCVDDPVVVDLVERTWASTPLFQLGVGMRARPRFDDREMTSALTLIEFDVDLNLPSQIKDAYTDAERISLAAIRCVTTASVGILSLSDGGVMATDEAHTVLGHADTVALNDKMMREGRSLNVGLVYASQLPSDVLSKGMETYISRVFAMALEDDVEAAAAIKLVGFEVTDERIRMLREAGPRRPAPDHPGRAAVSLHRDLRGRRSAVLHDPIPEDVFRAFSTNVDDRRAREAAAIPLPVSPVPVG